MSGEWDLDDVLDDIWEELEVFPEVVNFHLCECGELTIRAGVFETEDVTTMLLMIFLMQSYEGNLFVVDASEGKVQLLSPLGMWADLGIEEIPSFFSEEIEDALVGAHA